MEFRRTGQRIEPMPVGPFRPDNRPQVSTLAMPQPMSQPMAQPMPQAVPVTMPIYPILSIKPTAVRDKERLRLFVVLLTVRFLKECKALRKRDQKEWVPHSDRLVNQTLEGLKLTDGYCPDNGSIKRMCRSIIDELQRRFNTKRALETEELDCPLVETIVVQCMQTHIQSESTRLAEAATAGKACFIIKCLLLVLVILGGVAIAIYFLVFWKK